MNPWSPLRLPALCLSRIRFQLFPEGGWALTRITGKVPVSTGRVPKTLSDRCCDPSIPRSQKYIFELLGPSVLSNACSISHQASAKILYPLACSKQENWR